MKRERDDPRQTALDDTTPQLGGAAHAPTVAAGALDRAVEAPAGARIGRFVIGDRLGEGGMGVVVAAHDPTLDRTIALKLLRGRLGSSSAQRERLLREARAMARLSHPNVLTVHEAGVADDQVFIAMELATGGTLRAWRGASPRRWREILDRYLDAARGLVAAHQAGLVHRDFKPDNVLLTGDGRVRVADFGLVGGDGDGEPGREGDLARTATGSVVGTPAYMAPEQHRGEPVGPAADQFALCASLWEALAGRRPFEGESIAELARRKEAGVLAGAPASALPAWLRRVLERGLAPRAADRWPTMAALVAALEADPARRRRTIVAVAGVGALVIAAVLVSIAVARRGGTSPPVAAGPAPCRDAADRLADAWGPDRHAAIGRAFAAAGRPYSADTATRVTAQLDDYGAQWVQARTEGCEATRIHGAQSETLLDLRMQCLDRQRDELAELVAVLVAADAGVVDRAVELTARLPPPAACGDREALLAAVPPPADPDTARAVIALRRRLVAARDRAYAGQVEAGSAELRAIVAEARPLDHPPLLAGALEALGSVLWQNGEPAQARVTLEEAARQAAIGRDDALAADIWTTLVVVVGVEQLDREQAETMRQFADAAVQRAGGSDQLRSILEHAHALVLTAHGAYRDARPHAEAALALRERAVGADHVTIREVAASLGNVLIELGELDGAEVAYRRDLELTRQLLGPDHIRMADPLSNLAQVQLMRGELVEARAALERAIAITEPALGRHHREIASYLHNLGIVDRRAGDLEVAHGHLTEALAITEELDGANGVEVGHVLVDLGAVMAIRGDLAGAAATTKRAVIVLAAGLGPQHPDVTSALANLGQVLRFAEGSAPHAAQRATIAADLAEAQRAVDAVPR